MSFFYGNPFVPLVREILEPEHEPIARQAAEWGLCEHCLGRCLARVDFGLGNDERGRLLAKQWDLEPVSPDACHVCEALFERLDTFADVVDEALSSVEFDTYLLGTRVDPGIEEREQTLWAAIGAEDTESITSELNREVGKRVDARHEETPERGWEVEFQTPEVTAILDTRFDHVDLTFRSLFLYGRYRKHVRGIPQTKWPCRKCKGVGCTRCQGSGRQYILSVEALIEAPALELTGASEAKFHGAGREDVDAKCLGTGRPFVLEIVDPVVRRTLDLDELAEAINSAAEPAVDVGPLMRVDKDAVQRVKAAKGRKVYQADVTFSDPVARETLMKACHMLEETRVAQRTPNRVSHRRADKVRERSVRRCEVRSTDADGLQAHILVEGDAGLYIKELISGDEGRTEPSLASELGVEATCTALDVVAVEGPEGLEDARSHPPTE